MRNSASKLPPGDVLLGREEFKAVVFKRAAGTCVFCSQRAVDAHHIIERKLFPDGGHYSGNGAAVCERDHWKCETTELSVEEVRRAACIQTIVLPPAFDSARRYDKWGNEMRQDGMLIAGPLVDDVGMRRALEQGGKLGRLLRKEWL
ncbi:hypothetical protein F6X40_27770 [Paraburkholderia sp. UCT31]|uniref:hypothetical protein n=1 Tax=Paraburkholderia sp. UCT31 TaxID=2615209 RepID=UPI001655565A|nr:hypothetical protein [Paraburkholderia sp. UCT31]MBC8740438.1 hypothetical protein [Paraburkholderia sp. UCT31]